MNAIAETSGMGTNRWINHHVKNFPVPQADSEKSIQLEQLVSEIIIATKDNKKTYAEKLEKQIDRLVYKFYGLTEEEIAIVEEGV